jgi:hypothetical protein
MEAELVMVEEVYSADNRGLHNHIKAGLTENTVRINQKGIKQYEAPNFANFLMFTNHAIPFPIERGDRRFFMIFSESMPKEQSYYVKMVGWLKENTNTVYSWAVTRKLSHFDPGKAPIETREKEEALIGSETGLAQKLREAKEGRTWPFQHDVVKLNELQAVLNTGKYQLSVQKLANEMKRAGCELYHMRPTLPNGTRPRLWIVRDIDKYMQMNGVEMVEFIEGKHIGAERDYYSGGSL